MEDTDTVVDDLDTGPLKFDFTPEEQALIGQLRAKHKRVYAVKFADHGLLVLRRPSRGEWRKYEADLEKRNHDHFVVKDNLLKTLMVCPVGDDKKIDNILDDFPAMQKNLLILVELMATGDSNEVVSDLGKA